MAPRPGPNDILSSDEDTIKQQLLPLLKTEEEVDDFPEEDQFSKYTGFGSDNIQFSFPGFFEWLKKWDRRLSNVTAAAKVAAYRKSKSETENRIRDDLKKFMVLDLATLYSGRSGAHTTKP
jgi:hypothetical protein